MLGVKEIDIANVVTVIVSFMTLIFIIHHSCKGRLKLIYSGIIILWKMHELIFYGEVFYSRWFLGIDSSAFFQLWSAYLRAHSAISLFLLALTMIRFRGKGGRIL